MSGPECCSNPPSLNPIAGSGHVDKIGALNAYIAGSPNSNSAVLLVSDVFGYEAPNFRKLADKVAAAGYYVVVPDFLNGEPFNPENPNKPWPIWIKDHGTDKGFEDAELIVEIIKSKGVSSVAAAGFCWGAKVVTELAKAKLIEVVVLLHPSLVSLDDIKGVDIPISILGAEIDRTSPPELVKQFEEILAANSVTSFVKIFPKVSHGWTVRYKPEDAEEVKAAEEAHQDLLDWFSKHLKPTELLIVFQEQPASLILQQVTFRFFRVFEAMEGYKRWVRQNKEYVHSLESLANGLTWLLPERFSESEIGPEAVTTVLGIVTAINEHIIDSAPDQNITGSVEPNSFPYPLCLSALKDLETLVEVVAQHYYGDDRKWNFLAVTEGIKVLVRLSLFRKSGYKMLLHGGETSNDDSTSQHQIAANPKGRYNAGTNPWNLEARALSALSQFGEKARMVSDPVWLRRVQHQQAIVEPAASRVVKPTLSTILSKKGFRGALFLIGEVLFIIRPLIYVLFIRKYGIRSWTPWFLSLAIDTISNCILSLITTTVAGENQKVIHISAPEKDEVKRRKLLFVLYLMRDPFFSKYTRRKLESTEKVLEPVPIIGFLTAKIVELTTGAQTRYTYMSGS